MNTGVYVKIENSKAGSFIPDGKTKFCFLFGSNVAHSLSPSLHSKWFQRNNLNCVYLPLQIQGEKEFQTILQDLSLLQGFIGGNITLPFKHCALKLDFVSQSEVVKATQAANTIFQNKIGQWCFENTDLKGIEASINELVTANEPFEMIILGGGGAAATAVYYGIKNKNCSRVICLTRDPEKTLKNYHYLNNEKKFSINRLVPESIGLLFKNISTALGKIVLLNTLPLGLDHLESVGTYGEENVFAMEIIKGLNDKNCCYFDLIYEDTKTIKLAKENGIKNINGKLMLTVQAKESFLLWTGIQIMS